MIIVIPISVCNAAFYSNLRYGINHTFSTYPLWLLFTGTTWFFGHLADC